MDFTPDLARDPAFDIPSDASDDVAHYEPRSSSRVVDLERRRGRGAVSNASGRYESLARFAEDDGWGSIDDLPPFRTEVTEERPRTIITRNDSPDISFDRSINPYRGCEHGCVYCFARPTHAYMGLSPGLDFETEAVRQAQRGRAAREGAGHPSYKPRTIAMGTNTDPYQPIERRYRITRSDARGVGALQSSRSAS